MRIITVIAIVITSLPFCVYSQTMTVDEQDRVGIRNTSPEYTLHVKHANGTPAAGQSNGFSITHDEGPTWTLYVSNTNNELRFYRDGVPEVTFSGDGGVNVLSDEKKKKNIMLLPDGQLQRLMALSPKMYQYKNSAAGKLSTGFLAQELYKVLPSVVQYVPEDDDGNESWMVSYTSLVPYLVKGIQEQQIIIEQQRQEIELLKKQQEEILKRLAKLEN